MILEVVPIHRKSRWSKSRVRKPLCKLLHLLDASVSCTKPGEGGECFMNKCGVSQTLSGYDMYCVLTTLSWWGTSSSSSPGRNKDKSGSLKSGWIMRISCPNVPPLFTTVHAAKCRETCLESMGRDNTVCYKVLGTKFRRKGKNFLHGSRKNRNLE